MAIPSWLTVSPVNGSRNAQVTITASAHTGRSARSCTLSVKSSAGSPQKTANVNVNQAPKAEFLTVDAIPKQAASGNVSITISGKSNAEKIQFIAASNASAVESGMTPTRFIVNSATYTSNAAITGDPGVTAEYTWSVTVNIPVNQSVNDQSYRFLVKTPNTEAQTVTITQSGATPTLTLDKAIASIPQGGGSQTIAVTSNTSWTVS